ncbi:MAG TPA: ABC transporter permease [Firmicutes bacterium]|nr:ABC transporter permease [Bacillota bacterium]
MHEVFNFLKTPFTKVFWIKLWNKIAASFLALFTRDFWRTLLSKPGTGDFIASIVAIIGGLLIGFIIMLFTRPTAALPGLGMLIGGWIGQTTAGLKGIGNWIYYVGPILLCGLSVGFAFKTGLFNIGATGQFTVGMLCSVVVGLLCPFLGPFHWFVAALAGVLGGAFWGFFPGFFKAYFNVNEVITCIMFNYIGMYAVNWILISNMGVLYHFLRNMTITVPSSAFTPTWGLRNLFPGSAIDIGFIIAIVAAIILHIILNKTTFGYELKACGLNRHASKYGGINEKRGTMLAMIISGALAGLAGALFILASGAYNWGTNYEAANILIGTGFQGISVALLGMSSPIGIIFAALFITFIQTAGFYMQSLQYKVEIIDIIISTIIYFSALTLFIRLMVQRFAARGNLPGGPKSHKLWRLFGARQGPTIASEAPEITPISDKEEQV